MDKAFHSVWNGLSTACGMGYPGGVDGWGVVKCKYFVKSWCFHNKKQDLWYNYKIKKYKD